MNQREHIDSFLASDLIAVAGVSRNRNKFGSAVYRELKKKGFKLVPLNPSLETFEGDACFASISDLPQKPSALLCVVKPETTEKIVSEAADAGVNLVWMQQGAESPEAINFCNDKGINTVTGSCVLMYAEPVGSIHRFHRGIAKLFGRYQRQS